MDSGENGVSAGLSVFNQRTLLGEVFIMAVRVWGQGVHKNSNFC